jgi:TetR/AcrR family transcriptional repressor of nem operon
MDAIADAAGVKKANLFHYFPSKEELVLAVFDHAIRGFQERWAEKLRHHPEPQQVMAELFGDTARGMEQCGCKLGCFIGNLAQELSDTNETIRQKAANHFAAWEAQLGAYFERLRTEGRLRHGMEPAAAAKAVLALYQGAMLYAKATRNAASLVAAGQFARHIFPITPATGDARAIPHLEII